MARAAAGPAAPRVSAPDLPDDLDEVSFQGPGAEISQAQIGRLDEEQDASRTLLTECVLDATGVDRLDLTLARLADVELAGLRAAEVVATRGTWRNVRSVGGRVGALDFGRAELASVELRGIRVDYLTLAGATAADVVFVDCAIGTLDLPGATLSRVRFEGCRADEVDTRDLRAEHLDLRGLDALSFTSPAGLRGATLATRQVELLAADLAVALGIDVRD
ncbi:hypothetical protein LK09_04265 [Microbacterium mangrovi]|uniref:Pentapeptide repeat-containing protein n=1 Tax=Microbacterium mangrovi TaxID=1348253 RepID=A0A0B2A9I4_9MICO|nr:hypothetical protein [Microbacterium mangrovi]KHK98261.1 hypothetical protein LK09_04265 [Microbacterium mangrovi]